MLKSICHKFVSTVDIKRFLTNLVSATMDGVYARWMVSSVLLAVAAGSADKFIAFERGMNAKAIMITISFIALLCGIPVLDAAIVIALRVWKRIKEENSEC